MNNSNIKFVMNRNDRNQKLEALLRDNITSNSGLY